MDDLEKLLLGGAGAVLGLALLLLGAIGAVFFAFEAWVAGGTAPVPTPYLVSLWIPLVEQETARYGIPPQLDLGLIAHESGGDWLATNHNANGTTDAGLQQVNSTHWAAYGIAQDPYNPPDNVAAGVNILAAALAEYPNDLPLGLEAYNGFGAGYAAAVLSQVAGLTRGPQVFAWPIGGRIAKGLFGFLGGGQYLTPASAGPGEAYLVANALCPCGDRYTWEGQQWEPLLAPRTITVSYNGTTVPMAPPGSAPAALATLTPPHSRYYWTTIPLPPRGGTETISVTATWVYFTGQGKSRHQVTTTAGGGLAVQWNGR